MTSGHHTNDLLHEDGRETLCDWGLPGEVIKGEMPETLKIYIKNIFFPSVRLATSLDFLCSINAFLFFFSWELKMIL